MVLRSSGPKGVFSASFGLSALVFVLAPNQIGYQDVASLLVRQPAVSAHWRQHVRASAFGTIHAATFSFSRPIGTAMPRPLSYRLAGLDPRQFMTGAATGGPWPGEPPLEFPKVDRTAKGDRLPRMPSSGIARAAAQEPASEVSDVTPESEPNPPPPGGDIPDPIERNSIVPDAAAFAPAEPAEPVIEMARLYFGNEILGGQPGTIEKWAPGEEPIIVTPPTADPDIKLAAVASKPASAADAALDQASESIARKGEVTGEGRGPLSPAQRLGLDGKTRAKAEKCLADAIYFESRGEPVRGQMAVAQVVMNRVFSGFYPKTVCGTVYQNAHRRLACQFTFACDGIPETVTEPQAWLRATRIAKRTLDGELWVPEVNRATHYHADWVRPSWVRGMKRLYKFGVHTFYRPRAWGDGAEAPSWGDAAATKEAVATL
jgi:spore germination cell wall hydrolase CwlJ-like protein